MPRIAMIILAFAFQAAAWKSIEPGLELRWVKATVPTPAGDGRIAVVRIDPALWELTAVCQSRIGDSAGHTAREWARRHSLAVAVNAGMFGVDYLTHVGYFACRGHLNSGRVNKYKSVAAFDPRDTALFPRFRIFDLDTPGISIKTICREYATVIQNLRMIKKPGINCWSEQGKRWSEAALGEDTAGRAIIVFSRSPFTMRTLNAELLSAGIGLAALQHLEGGTEAQLYIKAGMVEIELSGSFATSFNENDGNYFAFPIPNVLGVKRKNTAGNSNGSK